MFNKDNLFQLVKQNIITQQAAESYGFQPNRIGMICCPFHADRNPSMKVDTRFHCFGCGADGDVIDFTAKLFQLSFRQAVEKLTLDFGLIVTNRVQPQSLHSPSNKKTLDAKEHFYKTLCGYRSLLASWSTIYAPQNPTEELHPCFLASLHYTDYMQYLLDIFLHGTFYEKQQLLNGKEVTALGKALAHCKESIAA